MNSFGMSIPSTYTSPDDVVVKHEKDGTPTGTEDGVTITCKVKNLGTDIDGKDLVLKVSQGSKGNWSGSVPSSYLPKN